MREAADEQVDTTTGEITEPLGVSPSLRDLLDALAHRPGLTPNLDDAIETVARLVPALDSDAHEARRTAMLEHFDTLKAHMPTVIENVASMRRPKPDPSCVRFVFCPRF